MKIAVIIFLSLLSLTLIAQNAAGGIDFPVNDLSNPMEYKVTDSPITEPGQLLSVIAAIAKWTYAIFLIVAVMFIIFAAFNYLTGGDEPEKIKTAHQQIKYAVIAIAVALIAVGFSLIIERFLKTEGGGARNTQQQIIAIKENEKLYNNLN